MTKGLRDCDTCGKPFVDEEGWKRQCVPCWKGDKDWKLAVGDRAFLSMQAAYVEQVAFNEEVAAVYLELSEKHDAEKLKLKKARQRVRALRKELKEREDTPPMPPPPAPVASGQGLTQNQIMSLLKLVHPDKHQNSELATQITKWLLAKRRR